jgi:hypothetical protein
MQGYRLYWACHWCGATHAGVDIEQVPDGGECARCRACNQLVTLDDPLGVGFGLPDVRDRRNWLLDGQRADGTRPSASAVLQCRTWPTDCDADVYSRESRSGL